MPNNQLVQLKNEKGKVFPITQETVLWDIGTIRPMGEEQVTLSDNINNYKSLEVIFVGHQDGNHVFGQVIATTGKIPIRAKNRNRGILSLGNNGGMYHRMFLINDNNFTFFLSVVYTGAVTHNTCVPIRIIGYK